MLQLLRSTILAVQNYLVTEDVLQDLRMGVTHMSLHQLRLFFRQIYFEACDLLYGELHERFSDKHIPSVISIEKILINAANGHDYEDTMDELKSLAIKMMLTCQA